MVAVALSLGLAGLILSSACTPEPPDNLLMSPIEQGSEHWMTFGETAIENNLFVVRNGGHFSQDVSISDAAGQYAVLISCVSS